VYVVLTAQRVEVFGVVIKLPEFTSSIQGASFGHSGQHGHTEAPVATNVRLINFQKLRGFAKDAGNLFIVHGPNYEPDQFPSAQRLARNLVFASCNIILGSFPSCRLLAVSCYSAQANP
jgi:hypothetical protein